MKSRTLRTIVVIVSLFLIGNGVRLYFTGRSLFEPTQITVWLWVDWLLKVLALMLPGAIALFIFVLAVNWLQTKGRDK